MSSNNDFIEVEGMITELLPATTFRVSLGNNKTIIAYLCGKMRKNNIKLIVGDKVRLEISPYDLERGRIIYRA